MTSLVFVSSSKKIKSVTVSSAYPSICQDFMNGNREERYPEGENSMTQKSETMYTDQEEENRPCTQIKKKSTGHRHRSK